jgi:nitroimidazol reductase NimA-like FMN-containing flavoprotein (pyridoxamine 5'-phosphate oxidase superfamily)
MKLSTTATDFIQVQGVARLATVSADGTPHNVPVCPVIDRGKVYVASEKGAKKVQNIESNPRAAIVFDEYRASWRDLRGVLLHCECGLTDQKNFKRIRRKLYEKYPKYETDAAIEPKDSVIIELVPKKKFSWGF